MLAHNNNRGMTYQTDEKDLTNSGKYFVGVGYHLNTCYYYVSLTTNHLKYI